MSILVVNSSEAECQEIEAMLRDGGFVQVRSVGTVKQAYELLGVEGSVSGVPGLDVELVVLEMMQELEGAQASGRRHRAKNGHSQAW